MDILPLFTSDNWQEQIGVHKVGLMLTESCKNRGVKILLFVKSFL